MIISKGSKIYTQFVVINFYSSLKQLQKSELVFVFKLS